MALPAIIDSVEGLSEDIAKEYKKDEKTGKYILDVTPVAGFALENVTGLKSSLQKERAEREKYFNDLKKYEGIDDPEAAREALQKFNEIKDWTPDKKTEEMLNSRTQELTKKHQKELELRDARLKSTTEQLQKVLVIEQAMKAITKEKGSVALLLPHVERNTRMREVDGKYIAEVIDPATGTVRVDNNGNALTIDKFVEELKSSDDFARAFEPSGSTGSGSGGAKSDATGGAGGSGAKIRIKKSDQAAINANWEKIASGEAEVVG